MRIETAIALTAVVLSACGKEKNGTPECVAATCGDTVPAPELDQVLPGPAANDNGPYLVGRASPGLTVRIYDDESCTNVRASGTAATFGSGGIQVPVLDDSTTTFRARVERDDGLLSACSVTSLTYVEDSTPPNGPTITGAVPTLSNGNTTVLFGEAPGAALVRVFANPGCTGLLLASGDAASFASTGVAVTTGDDATFTLWVRSVDAVGNVSSCSTTSATFVEDSTAPVFAGLASARYDGGGAALAWDAATEDVVYEVCRADTRSGCETFAVYDEVTTSTFADTAVASGATYFYRVSARDAAGNVARPRAEHAVYIGCGTGFLASGSGCTWLHGPTNWDFDTTGTWSQDGSPIPILDGTDTCAPGVEGYALIDRAVVCGDGGLRQTFAMPTYDQAGGMELTIGYTYDTATPCPDRCNGLNAVACGSELAMCSWTGAACVNLCATYDEPTCASTFGCVWNGACELNRFGDRCFPASVRADIGGRSVNAFPNQAPVCAQTKACLGEAQYGGARELAIAALDASACGAGSDTEIRPARLTFLSIEPEPKCPAPGEVNNGDFDFDAAGFSSPAGNTFAQGPFGDDGSRAGRFTIATRCGTVNTSTWYSVPSALTAPALELWLTRGLGSEVDITFAEGLGGLRLPPNATGTQRICLPPATRGSAFPFTVFASGPGDSLPGSGSDCSDAFSTFATIDSLRVANDARCAASSNVVNGNFELDADDLVTWWFNWTPTESGGPKAIPEIARGGVGRASDSAGHAVLDQCGSATLTTAIAVPAPVGGWGAALRAYYKYTAGVDGNARVGTSGSPQNALSPAADWTLVTVCLPQTTSPATVSFALSRFTSCGSSSPQELWVDDVEVVNDPSCP